jgi:exodeoxyribonuclease V gamma subunit
VLRVRLRDEDEPADEHEPVTVDGLTRYALEEEMVRRRIGREPDLARELTLLGARGDLPSGALTAPHHRQLHGTTRKFAGRVGAPNYLTPVGIRIERGQTLIAGRVDGLTAEGYLQFRPAKVKPKDRIRTWITHVALCAELGDSGPARFVGADKEVVWNVPDDPAAILDTLIAGYRAALLAPLPVFENASYEYVRPRRPNSPPPLAAAQKAFRVTEDPASGRPGGDLTDPSVALCWRGRDPFDVALAAFEEWSTALWEPAFDNQVWS